MEGLNRAARVVARCRELAKISDVPAETTRLFLSPATRDAQTLLSWWIRQAGKEVRVDDMGSVHAVRRGSALDSAEEKVPTLVLFSHLDTVPNAGAFDGPLGVLVGLAAMEELGDEALPFDVELIAFSEEEGVRFQYPFLASLAAVGRLREADLERVDKDGVSVAEALRGYGLRPEKIAASCALRPGTFATLEVHIEQGPVLEAEDAQIAVVDAVVGQSRLQLTFTGQANHAGTTPMALRRDALVAAAQWVVEVERYAASYAQLVATVGSLTVLPGAMNVVPGSVEVTLDVRHPRDESRHAAVAYLLTAAEAAGAQRGVGVKARELSQQRSVAMDEGLTLQLYEAAQRAGYAPGSMFSGAGHDAMVLAPQVPTTMLFVRSPGGLSHHPEETVREEDVEAALATVVAFVRSLRVPSVQVINGFREVQW